MKIWFKIGIIILTIGVLSPLVSGKIQLPNVANLLSWKMVFSVIVGMFVAWLAGKGVSLMGEQPILVTGLLVGTVIGVAFLGGFLSDPSLQQEF
ncbi:membrane protein [Rodentibacter pneumotropicus]|uniref:Membrane protein n=1 Tax=Rodentibacter pneumotropicus TaxID=758 RepID=A0A3S4U8W9_9PAST|nr:membrane protein [Rodentibacter pneumotropicus]